MAEFGSNFPDREFANASQRELTAAELELADWWRWNVLQPLRNELGPLLVTSFVRDPERGVHKDGNGLDVVPLAEGVTVRHLADRMAATALRAGLIRQVIWERDHVHLARILVDGARAGYLDENREGQFSAAALQIPPAPAGIRAVVVAVAAGWVVRRFL